MTEKPVDMSPQAIERRLAHLGELYRLAVSLRKARRLGPEEGPPAPAGKKTP